MPSKKRNIYTALITSGKATTPSCPICLTQQASLRMVWDQGGFEIWQGWCPACTNVNVESAAVEKVRQQNKGYLLAAYLRSLPEEDARNPIGLDQVENLIGSITELSISEQFDLGVKVICDMCPVVGQHSTFNYEEDWPLLTAQSKDTARFILVELMHAGYLQTNGDQGPFPPSPTWKAYQRLQEMRSSGRNSEIGFVAMWFAPELLPVWTKVIKPGVENAGYRPFRVDQVHHNNRIDDEIIANIKRCRFIVADCTGQRQGVYFEAGMALGLGRNVIWMCNKGEEKLLHFDTRQFFHILYLNDDIEATKFALTNHIVALEGQGTYVPPSEVGH